jgi:hypothetical protein
MPPLVSGDFACSIETPQMFESRYAATLNYACAYNVHFLPRLCLCCGLILRTYGPEIPMAVAQCALHAAYRYSHNRIAGT